MTEALNSFAQGVSIDGTFYTEEEFAEIRKIQKKHDVELDLAALMFGWWNEKTASH
jgi:hypothetical protein